MDIQLSYFTVTGNSLKVLNVIKESFEEAHHFVQISEIKIRDSIPQCDIIGFCLPVYTFGIGFM